ncbi:MAG: HAD family hydrolase [Clostridia bacterium]|nr:HAD family hydrolase [Clostridia bacterium]
MKKDFKIVGFDADDTLWVNEPYYQEIEGEFIRLISVFADPEDIARDLHEREIDNLGIYGYGAKGFMLSMIETAVNISNGKVGGTHIAGIIAMGRDLINKPITLIEGVESVLRSLYDAGIKLIVATKGDLLDQERKLAKSGLSKYFDHIEIMSYKTDSEYQKMLGTLGIEPDDFLMVGNSMKSDIIPVLDIGGYAVYVPYHTTWAHELVENTGNLGNFHEIREMKELRDVLGL